MILWVSVRALWAFRIVANVASYSYLWFIKEYRFDRMLTHLRTRQGRRWLMPELRRPPTTPKAAVLFITTVSMLMWGYWVLPLPTVGKLIVLDLLSFPLTFLVVAFLAPPTHAYHAIVIGRAGKKFRAHRQMKVIGITGSYGKTSTKEFLATILSKKFATLKTEASKNSPIGIAEVILGKLAAEHEMFVVEMAAYKRGEIAEMVRMVKPQIGIMTAINPQHQDLFGSIENTVMAKYELLEGLTRERIAIVNADDVRTRHMGERARREGCTVWWVSREKSFWKESGQASIKNFRQEEIRLRLKKPNITGLPAKTFFATDIRATKTATAWTCVSGKETVRVRSSILGEHQVSNMLSAIAAAVAAGMTLDEAAKASASLKSPKGIMQRVAGINGAIFIDDTWNNNPDAAKAACAFLEKCGGRKILVFQPMIELGPYASSSHREVGECAGRICDDVLLTNENWHDDFLTGIRRARRNVTVMVLSPTSAAAYIRQRIKKGDMVLFKGKEAARVLGALQS